MAKTTKPSKKEQPPVKDRSIWWSEISYMLPQYKNEYWAAQILYFAKKNAKLFLDPVRAREYRKLDLLEIDPQSMREMIDPKTPEGDGGTATYFSSDMKAYPIYIRLQNTIRAEVQRTAKQIEVNFTDKFAKTRKMRDSYRVLYSKLFRDIINEYAPLVGLPKISESQDPYKWTKSLVDDTQGGKKEDGDKPKGSGDVIGKYVDLIKNQVQDSQDLALYNELVYKGDYEQAIEKGIQHYMFGQNKWDERWSDEFFDDIRHFNRASGEWYTDLVTGRPVIERFVPEILYVSPFKRKDGSDAQYYFIEYLISFADFVKTIGHDLTPEKLKEVFEFQKTQGSTHGFDWVEMSERPYKLWDDAMIRVGRCSCLTQDYEVMMDGVQATFPKHYSSDWDWLKDPNNTKDKNIELKNYNVWRTFYYIPPTTAQLSNADYNWQANFIFDIKKNQDQFRYGEEGRYVKSPLVIYDNSKQASFTDIVKSFTSKIDFAWQQYQNCLINDVDALILSDDFLGGLLSAVEEDNNISPGLPKDPSGGNGQDALKEQWSMIKQGGKGFLKMTDKQGKPLLDPAKLMVAFKNGYLDRAEKWMANISILYNQMITALGSESGEAKPRVPVAGVQEQLKNTDNSRWFIQKAYESFVKDYGERFVQYILAISKEPRDFGYHNRFDEFKDVIGMANGLMIEGLEDIAPESIGLTVSYVDNTSKKEFLMQQATAYSSQGKLDDDIVYLMMGIDNWKVATCMMRLGITKKKKEMAAQAELAHQQAMEQKEMDLKIAMAMQDKKAQGKDHNIITQAKAKQLTDKAQNENKSRSMAEQKQQLLNNKLQQENQKHQLQRQDETYDAVGGGS